MKCKNCGAEHTVDFRSTFYSQDDETATAYADVKFSNCTKNDVIFHYSRYSRWMTENCPKKCDYFDYGTFKFHYDGESKTYTLKIPASTYDRDCVWYRYTRTITFKFDDTHQVIILKEEDDGHD